MSAICLCCWSMNALDYCHYEPHRHSCSLLQSQYGNQFTWKNRINCILTCWLWKLFDCVIVNKILIKSLTTKEKNHIYMLSLYQSFSTNKKIRILLKIVLQTCRIMWFVLPTMSLSVYPLINTLSKQSLVSVVLSLFPELPSHMLCSFDFCYKLSSSHLYFKSAYDTAMTRS